MATTYKFYPTLDTPPNPLPPLEIPPWDGTGLGVSRSVLIPSTNTTKGRYLQSAAAAVPDEESPRTEVMIQFTAPIAGFIPNGREFMGQFRMAVGRYCIYHTSAPAVQRRLRTRIRVFAANKTTLRGVIFDGASTWFADGTHRVSAISGDLIPGTVVSAGDVLVIEVAGEVELHTQGLYDTAVLLTSSIPADSINAPDLPFTNNLALPDGNPWFAFDLSEPPKLPRAVEVDSTTQTTAHVIWLPPSGGATAEEYEYRVDGGAPQSAGSGTSVTISDLTPDTDHTIQVRAYGEGFYSSWTTATTFHTKALANSRVLWHTYEGRTFEAGIDRGVLYPKNGRAVAWNGLSAVDENGGESATEFFMDGRPFLYLPKGKEYTATLKAYTYPDEFAEIMGVAEAAPGMYLDSQIGDSFDLSYRTLVGGMNSGEPIGYKIHLIYNATAVPSAVSYQTLSSEINPVEFSWDIQAVPVAVPGYRATAHITIDTRRMAPDRVAAVEALLYGTGSIYASMPTPEAIFEELTFGDAIIITDNGDGTWSAEGSFRNITLLSDGNFTIDNVNATFHGDGEYDVSSTP